MKARDIPVVSENDNIVLRKAFLLSKSVPRQTSRSKWRERSGFQPNLLLPTPAKAGKLLKNDIVFARGLQGEILNLMVNEDLSLNDVDKLVHVSEVGRDVHSVIQLKQDVLLVDNGLIAVVPHGMYTIDGGQIDFDDNVQNMLNRVNYASNDNIHDDDEWAELLQCSSAETTKITEATEELHDEDSVLIVKKSRVKRKRQVLSE